MDFPSESGLSKGQCDADSSWDSFWPWTTQLCVMGSRLISIRFNFHGVFFHEYKDFRLVCWSVCQQQSISLFEVVANGRWSGGSAARRPGFPRFPFHRFAQISSGRSAGESQRTGLLPLKGTFSVRAPERSNVRFTERSPIGLVRWRTPRLTVIRCPGQSSTVWSSKSM